MKKVVFGFFVVVMGIVSLVSTSSVYASNQLTENPTISYDRMITEPKILTETFESISPRVQVFKFSILFPVGMYPPKTWQTLAYLGHLESVTYVGGGQYIGHYTTGW